MDDTNNMRQLKTVLMVEVLEGRGTEDYPYRDVQYFYDKDGRFIGKIDRVGDQL